MKSVSLYCVALAIAGILTSSASAIAAETVQSTLPLREHSAFDSKDEVSLPSEARKIVTLALDGDAAGKPFIIVDKRHARVFVFRGDGRMIADAPALLGSAIGDDSAPGVGDRPLALIRPRERTTPAGRFSTTYGANLKGDPMLWVDYDAAIALHSVAVTNPKEHRARRLATPSTEDNRASFGCINVQADVFALVTGLFSNQNGVVYVLPEVRSFDQVFAGLASSSAAIGQ